MQKGGVFMIGPKRTCSKCEHDCHCYAPDCQNCINDVCVKCECSSSPTFEDWRVAIETDATVWKWNK